MTLSLSGLLNYWRAALLDSNRHIDPDTLSLHPLAFGNLRNGQLERPLTATLWAEAETGLSRRERERMSAINLVVAFQLLQPEYRHSAISATMDRMRVPMWLCLQVTREGKLLVSGNPGDQIIVDRAVLAPASGAQTFSQITEVDDYIGNNPPPADGSDWPAFWRYADQMFTSLFGEAADRFAPRNHVNLGAYIACGTRPADASKAIRKVYDTLIDQDDVLAPLLRRLISPREAKDVTGIAENAALKGRHLGQMSGDFPLNRSQRRSLSAVNAVADGEIVAVNGPPGTGKTTFIQSVVASLWVERALVEGGEPPVILASSTNNKAITNILDTFARASLATQHPLSASPLIERWLPEVAQYGLYLPSKREVEKGIRPEHAAAWCHQYGQPWSGLPGSIENDTYIQGAKDFWLSRFRDWAGQGATDLKEATETLRELLQLKAAAMKAALTLKDTTSLLFNGRFPTTSDIARLRALIDQDESRLQMLRECARTALELSHGSLLEAIFSWVPAVKRRLWSRVHSYLDAQNLADPAWTRKTFLGPATLRAWLDDLITNHERVLGRKKEAVANWSSWLHALQPILAEDVQKEISATPDKLDERLDTLVRPELFHLAARYWEGRWLIEVDAATRSKDKTFTGRDRDACERRWRRFAKLTPCMVSTAYTAPRLFDYYKGSTEMLADFIDLLIVDEAGQVPPQVGGALFALARKALIVGDTQQLEPVWGIDTGTDLANLDHFQMTDQRQPLQANGMMASEGSVMAMAQAATAFAMPPHRGLFLEEHWRCRAPVIAYSNELAYGGALKPMRPDSAHPLPPLGYAHVPGRAVRAGTSWTNAEEAVVMAKWLGRRKRQLIEHHGARTLGEIVAIVTPFRAQIEVLNVALQSAGLTGENITVGTVHTLQGAEKAIVMFSSVNTAGRSAGLFIDRGVSMLNVAVSRARESFLVFGDIGLFRPEQPSLPSGLLGVYLFSKPENEITDIDPISRIVLEVPSDVERISSLEGHRETLRRSIEDANERLLIVSPYLTGNAIEADGLAPLLDQRRNDLRVVVAYDQFLNTGRDRRLQPGAASAIQALTTAGVELWPLNGAHNKTLAVDQNWIAEGSFNWLSALRDRESDYQRHEVSLIYRGADAATYVDKAWQEIEALRLDSKRG